MTYSETTIAERLEVLGESAQNNLVHVVDPTAPHEKRQIRVLLLVEVALSISKRSSV